MKRKQHILAGVGHRAGAISREEGGKMTEQDKAQLEEQYEKARQASYISAMGSVIRITRGKMRDLKGTRFEHCDPLGNEVYSVFHPDQMDFEPEKWVPIEEAEDEEPA